MLISAFLRIFAVMKRALCGIALQNSRTCVGSTKEQSLPKRLAAGYSYACGSYLRQGSLI